MSNKKLTYEIDADVKGYQEGMEEAVYSTDKTEAAIQDLIESTPALKKSLRDATKEAQNLAAAFAQLSDEEKKSAPGRQLAQDLQLAMEKAAELQDVMGDTQTAIRNLSSDTQTLDALNEGFSAMGSAVSGVLGVIGTLTGKQEDFNRAIAAYTTVESAGNAVTKIRNMFQKESNVMLAIGRVQTAALTKAQELQTAATVKATIAQKAFNVVAKANPYVLLATAVVAVGAALAAFIIHSNKAKKAHEEEKAALEQEKEALDAYKNTLTSSLGQALTSYKSLQEQWKNCNTELSKTEFIKKHQSEFKKLGVEVKNTADAENVFDKNTEAVKEGLMKRAKAAAKAAQAQVYYGQAIAETIALESLQSRKLQELAEAKDETVTQIVGTSTSGAVMTTSYTITAAQKRAKIEEKYMKEEKQRQARIEELNGKGDKLIGEAVDEGYGADTGGSSGRSKPSKEQLTRYEELKKKADEAYKAIQNLDEYSPTFKVDKQNAWKTYEDALKTFKDYGIEIGIETPESEVDKFKKKLKDEITKAEDNYALAYIKGDEAGMKAAEEAGQAAQDTLDKMTLHVKVKPEVDLSKAKEDIDKITKKLNEPKEQKYDFSFLPDNYRDQADDALDRLNELKNVRNEYNSIIESNTPKAQEGDKLAIEYINQAKAALSATDAEYIKLTNDVQKYIDVCSQIKERNEDFENFQKTVSSINDVVGSIDGVVNAVNNLNKAFDENKNGWEKFMAIWQTAMSIMQAVTTVMEIINTVQDIMNVKKAISGSIVSKEAAAQVALTTAQGTGIGTTTGFAAAQAAAIAPTLAMATALKELAAAQIFAAHAYIPFAGPPLAAGYVTMMESVIASIAAFAGGGIVPGGKSLQDNRLAMVSSGEMILNQRQQDNLFKAIDQDKLGGGGSKVEVTGVLRGKDLLLVQKNYNTTASRGQKIRIN